MMRKFLMSYHAQTNSVNSCERKQIVQIHVLVMTSQVFELFLKLKENVPKFTCE